MRQHRAGDAEQAEHIGAEQLRGLRGAGLLDRAQQAIAGIVDEDVDAAEFFHRLAGGLMGLSLAGHVEPCRQQPLMRAEAGGDGVGIASGGDYRITRLQCGFRDQSAKTPGSSCDEPDAHVVALSIVAGAFAEPDGQKLAARHI
jgi:hypothetical protein